MTYEVCLDGDIVGRFVYFATCGGRWTPGMGQGIAIMKDGEFAAAAAFESWNRVNINMHVWVGDKHAVPLLAHLCYLYLFEQLGVSRVTLLADCGKVPEYLIEKMGAIPEGRLKGAGQYGDDILVARLERDSKLWRRWNGRLRRTSATELRSPDSPSGPGQPDPVPDPAPSGSG